MTSLMMVLPRIISLSNFYNKCYNNDSPSGFIFFTYKCHIGMSEFVRLFSNLPSFLDWMSYKGVEKEEGVKWKMGICFSNQRIQLKW